MSFSFSSQGNLRTWLYMSAQARRHRAVVMTITNMRAKEFCGSRMPLNGFFSRLLTRTTVKKNCLMDGLN